MEKTLLNQTENCGTNGHVKYAGVQRIIELRIAKHLNSLPKIQEILEKVVQACGATLLRIDLRALFPNTAVYVFAAPTSIGGLFSCIFASQGGINPMSAAERATEKKYAPLDFKTRYCSRGVHVAAFRTPDHVKGIIDDGD